MICQKIGMVFKVVVFSVAFFFTRTGELMVYCIRKNYLNQKVAKQIWNDIQEFPKDRMKSVESKIQSKCAANNLNKIGIKNLFVQDFCKASYAISYIHYGPVVLDWAKSILDTALVKKRKLVLLARDSLAPYKVAKMLKKQFPEKYGNVEMFYVYLSRKVIDDAATRPGFLKDYLLQEGIKKDDRCLFADIGFAGSRIGSTRKQLQELNLNIKFQYLISHTRNARGFMADMKTKLSAVEYAGDNPAVSWLEDSHQGGIESPARLIKGEKGVIYPSIAIPGTKIQTCKSERPVEYVLKKFSLKGILHYAQDQLKKQNSDEMKSEVPTAWRMASETLRKAFNDFLTTYHRGDRCLYFKDKN